MRTRIPSILVAAMALAVFFDSATAYARGGGRGGGGGRGRGVGAGGPRGPRGGEVTHVLRAGAAEATPVRPAAGLHDLRNCLPAAGPHARPVAEFHVPPAGVEVLHDPLNCLPVVLRVQAEVACLRLQASVPRVEIDLRSAGGHLNCLLAIVPAEGQGTARGGDRRTTIPSCLPDRYRRGPGPGCGCRCASRNTAWSAPKQRGCWQ